MFVVFDLACRYGINPGNALISGVVLWMFCSMLYFVFIHAGGKTGLYRVPGDSLQTDGTAHRQIELISPMKSPYTWGRLSVFQWFWRKFSLLRTAMFFS